MQMSMPAKAAWVPLWTECDDSGIFEWKPVVLKARIFPADNVDMAAILEEYRTLGQVDRFSHDGRSYGVVRNFCRYQRPKNPSYRFVLPIEFREFVGIKAPNSDSPPPALPQDDPIPTEIPTQMKEEGGRMDDEEDSSNPVSPSLDAPEGAPRDLLGDERPKKAKAKPTDLPEDWRPSPELVTFANELGVDVVWEMEKFRDYWAGKRGKSEGRKSDWPATFRNWCRGAVDRRRSGGAWPPGQQKVSPAAYAKSLKDKPS